MLFDSLRVGGRYHKSLINSIKQFDSATPQHDGLEKVLIGLKSRKRLTKIEVRFLSGPQWAISDNGSTIHLH